MKATQQLPGERDESSSGRAKRRVVVLVLSVLPLSGCAEERPDPGREAGGRSGRSRKVVVAVNAEPTTLNPFLASGALALNAHISDKVLLGAWRVSPDFELIPNLLAGEPTVDTDPFRVTYRIRPEAVWNDGTPVSARDFEFTWKTVVDPRWEMGPRDGYDKISGAEIVDPHTVRFTFAEPYGHWRLLFLRGGVLPSHLLEGKNFNEVWRDEITAATGPFMFNRWVKGDHLSLVRNPRYFGKPATVDEIELRFIPDSNTAFQQFRAGDVDVLNSVDDATSLRRIEGARTEVRPGGQVLYLTFNTRDPLLGDARVRRAVSLAIDREKLVKGVFGRNEPGAEPLDSLVYLRTQAQYVAHFDRYKRDVSRTAELLEEAGCTRTPGSLYQCQGRPLRLRLGVLAGDEPSRLLFDILQADLQQAGIGVTAEFDELNALVRKATAGDFQLLQVGMQGAPEPVLADLMWRCGASLNVGGYCNREADAHLERGARELDRRAAAASYNAADAVMADDPPALPMAQVPVALAWHERVTGPRLNPAWLSPFWNAEDWSVAA